MNDSREVNLFEVEFKQRNYADITGKQREVLLRFDREYYDDPTIPGFRGYEYNGSWREIARNIANYFNLDKNATILDIGCAKGFLLYDFKMVNPRFNVHGVDISQYAIESARPEVRQNLICTSCTQLPYEDGMFDLVISTDTLHNLTKEDCRRAVREINRVGKQNKFIMVHSYRSRKERENLIKWEATIQSILSVDEWKQLYLEENYSGLYYWKIFI